MAGNLARNLLLMSLLAATASKATAQTAAERLEAQVRQSIGPTGPRHEPGHLGVLLDDATRDDGGVVVRAVRPGSPAAEAGLRDGDLIAAVDGDPVRSFADFAAIMREKAAGEDVELSLLREGKPLTATATLGARPVEPSPGAMPPAASGPLAEGIDGQPEVAPDRIGLITLEVTPDIAATLGLPDARGALTIYVVSGSPAQQANIPRNAVLLAVDGKKIDTPADWIRMLTKAGNSTIKVAFAYRGQLMERKIDLSKLAPVAPDLFGPGEPVASLPAPAADATRVQALERRVAEMEARIAHLESLLQQAEPTRP